MSSAQNQMNNLDLSPDVLNLRRLNEMHKKKNKANKKIEAEHHKLKLDHDKLQKRLVEQTNLQRALRKIKELEKKIAEDKMKHQTLKELYNRTRNNNHQNLQKISSLERDFENLKQNNKVLQEKYDTLKYNHGEMMMELKEKHENEERMAVFLENQFEKKKKLQIEISNYKKILEEN